MPAQENETEEYLTTEGTEDTGKYSLASSVSSVPSVVKYFFTGGLRFSSGSAGRCLHFRWHQQHAQEFAHRQRCARQHCWF